MSSFIPENNSDAEHNLKIVTSNDYWTVWTTLYGEDSFPDDSEKDGEKIVESFRACGEDAKKLQKLLYQWLCIVEESSSYAEDFCESEFTTLTKCIIEKVPSKLPCHLLGPLTSLLCRVTFGVDRETFEEHGSDPNYWPSWLFPLLHACQRSALIAPQQSGYLQAIDTLLKYRSYRKVTSHYEGIETIFQAAFHIIKSASTVTTVAAFQAAGQSHASSVSIYCAIELLSDRIRIIDEKGVVIGDNEAKSSAEKLALSYFEPLTAILTIYLNRISLQTSSHEETSSNDQSFALLLASVTPILGSASALLKFSGGERYLISTGFLNTIIDFGTEYCCENVNEKDSKLAYEALSSIAGFLTKLVLPKGIHVSSPESAFRDDAAMKQLFDGLVNQYGALCDSVIELKGDVLISQALIRNESRDHLFTPHALHLSGILALLTFSSEEFTIKMIGRLEKLDKWIPCLQAHAKGKTWTYSSSWGARIMGTTKEAVNAQMIISCAFPDQFPSSLISHFNTEDIEESSRGTKVAKTEIGFVLKENVPSPKAIIEEAIKGTRNRLVSKSTEFVEDWMLCLAFL